MRRRGPAVAITDARRRAICTAPNGVCAAECLRVPGRGPVAGICAAAAGRRAARARAAAGRRGALRRPPGALVPGIRPHIGTAGRCSCRAPAARVARAAAGSGRRYGCSSRCSARGSARAAADGPGPGRPGIRPGRSRRAAAAGAGGPRAAHAGGYPQAGGPRPRAGFRARIAPGISAGSRRRLAVSKVLLYQRAVSKVRGLCRKLFS